VNFKFRFDCEEKVAKVVEEVVGVVIIARKCIYITIDTTGGGGLPFLKAPVCWLAVGLRLSLACCMGSG